MSTFKSARDKYKDLHSSYICLLVVGILGLFFVALDYFKVLPFSFTSNGNFMFYIVMGSLFTIFIIIGITTFINAKKIKETINDEEYATDQIISWAKASLTSEDIDNTIDGIEECIEEEKYLLRYEALYKTIAETHNLDDEQYINSLTDEIYPELFD